MIIKKRQLMLAALVAVLAAAVFVNWYYTKPDVESAQSNSATTLVNLEDNGANLGDARYVISSDISLDDAEASKAANEYFASAKLRRQTARDEACEALNDIIKDSSSAPDAVEKATVSLNSIAESITLESDIENLIYAKAGCENLVILNGGTAEIIVENGSLDDMTLVQIKEIVVKQTGYPVSNISIVEMKY